MSVEIKSVIQVLKNELNAALGRKQELVELLSESDLTRVKDRLENFDDRIGIALSQYDPTLHNAANRPDKKRKGKEPKKTAKLPIPFQRMINQQATAFLFGQEGTFSNNNKDTDEAFRSFMGIINNTRFHSTIREAKTLAGAETISAKLYHLYLEDGEVAVKTKILAYSKGDHLYYKKDEFGKLIVFGRYYETTTNDKTIEKHFDVYTSEQIFRGKASGIGWKVEVEANFIGKIPVIIYEQPVEWDGVQPLIDRREEIQCKDADVNDYFADPKLVGEGVIKGLPDPDDPGAVIQVQNGGKLSYLTYDSAPENRINEYHTLERLIYGMTFSADISFDTIKNMTIPSGKAWRYVFTAPLLKAKNHQDRYGELIDREINLIKAIMKVLFPKMDSSNEIDLLDVSYEFASPMPDDVLDDLTNIKTAVDGGFMSLEGAVRQNPLVEDYGRELERLAQERAQEQQRQQNLRMIDITEPTF
jgi:SPP1 family phage portal protein